MEIDNSFLIVLLLGAVGWLSSAVPHGYKHVSEIPSDVPTCSEKESNLNECIKSAFQEMVPRMKDGVPALNIPPLDPFVLEKSNFQYSSGVVQGHIALKNVRITGLSNSVVESVDFDLQDGHMRMEVATRVPSLLVEGLYKADMKFNEVKMTPKGYFNVSMTDIQLKARPEGELYERDDHTYLRLTSFDADPYVGDMKIYANGLFPDPTLNAVILDFVNQYWRQIYRQMLPETRKDWEPLIIQRANEFFAALPFDLLLTKN